MLRLGSFLKEEATEMAENAEEVVEQLSTSHLKLILGDSRLSSSPLGTAFRVPLFLNSRTYINITGLCFNIHVCMYAYIYVCDISNECQVSLLQY